MGSSLKSFIKDIRNAKTLADQRTIITKQSAKIRTKLRDDHLPFSKRRQNISKLLYLYILGEPTHFAQVECINLIASDQFVDKRLGYLATMLLLDEKQDLLTLLTNLLQIDLHHPNKYIISLALSTLGSLSSYELARDLYPDVMSILSNDITDPFIMAKCLQCLAKLLKRDNEWVILEVFSLDPILRLLNDSNTNHSVWLGICKTLQSIANVIVMNNHGNDPPPETIVKNLIKTIKPLMTQLSSLNGKNYESNYDIQGVRDPFLQCEIIITLKSIFTLSQQNSSFQNIVTNYKNNFIDLLTQLTNNSSLTLNKNPSNAILYEVTRTIFQLDLDPSLRLLGVNILANFLRPTSSTSPKGKKSNKTNTNNNNNTKYVALNTLIRVVLKEPNAIAKHRQFISNCLYDPDISIKFRSLELTFAIISKTNLIETIDELIKFLKHITLNNNSSDYVYIDMDESKELIDYTIDNYVKRVELYNETTQDEIKLKHLFEIIELTGSIISLDKMNEFLITINNIDDWNIKINTLISTINKHTTNGTIAYRSNICWNLIIVWSIGEYGDMIIKQSNGTLQISQLINYLSQLNNLYSNMTSSSSNTDHITLIQYILTSALKLSAKIDNDPSNIEILRQIILSHQKDPNLMIQLKSNQYELIFNQPLNVKKLMLDTMPKFVRQTTESVTIDKTITSAPTPTNAPSTNSVLLDLLTDVSEQPTTQVSSSPLTTQEKSLSLPTENIEMIFNNDMLEVYSYLVEVGEGHAHYELYFKPLITKINELHSLCAVPKQQKLTLGQIQPRHQNISNNDIVKQSLKIVGTGKLKLRIKLNVIDANNQSQQFQFDHKFNQTI